MIWTTSFWKGLGERALKTFCMSLAGVFGTGAVGLLEVDWVGALSVASMATLLSVLTAIGNSDFTSGASSDVTEISEGKHTTV